MRIYHIFLNYCYRSMSLKYESLFDQDKINEEDFTFLINAFDEIQCLDAVKLLRGNCCFRIHVLLYFLII
jgi:hypothetical protein